jgi:hypothetical protein
MIQFKNNQEVSIFGSDGIDVYSIIIRFIEPYINANNLFYVNELLKIITGFYELDVNFIVNKRFELLFFRIGPCFRCRKMSCQEDLLQRIVLVKFLTIYVYTRIQTKYLNVLYVQTIQTVWSKTDEYLICTYFIVRMWAVIDLQYWLVKSLENSD